MSKKQKRHRSFRRWCHQRFDGIGRLDHPVGERSLCHLFTPVHTTLGSSPGLGCASDPCSCTCTCVASVHTALTPSRTIDATGFCACDRAKPACTPPKSTAWAGVARRLSCGHACSACKHDDDSCTLCWLCCARVLACNTAKPCVTAFDAEPGLT
eukprot:353494-Chlamydomonas_euryale.AAC.4